jgi:hypothetical protein
VSGPRRLTLIQGLGDDPALAIEPQAQTNEGTRRPWDAPDLSPRSSLT